MKARLDTLIPFSAVNVAYLIKIVTTQFNKQIHLCLNGISQLIFFLPKLSPLRKFHLSAILIKPP